MLYLDKNKMNEIVTLEEANDILAMAKRLYSGILDGIYIEYDDNGYAFCRIYDDDGSLGARHIQIFETPNDELIEVGEKILKYVNEEFDANLAINLKTISIHALCHEIGHAIDFRMKEILQNEDYEDEVNEEYNYFYNAVQGYYEEMDALAEYMYDNEITVADESVEKWMQDLDAYKDYLDYSYRQITTEYAADKFSCHFIKTHLRYIPYLFNNR